MIRFFRKKKTDCLLKRDVTAEVMSCLKGLKGFLFLVSSFKFQVSGLKGLKGLSLGIWSLEFGLWILVFIFAELEE
jgi:hypothetical protein